MLNETVNAPNFFITSMVAKNAKDVHAIPKNNNQPKRMDREGNSEASERRQRRSPKLEERRGTEATKCLLGKALA